jgi:AcrR family transcriptional regulator
MDLSAPPAAAPESTRQALIAAGIRLFGRQGFAATSVRQLAQEAGANIAAIAYHFGGKDGLRLACAEEFGRRMGQGAGAVPHGTGGGPAAARAELRQIVCNITSYLLGGPGSSEMVPFMLRELAEAGPGVDAVYRSFAEPMHRRLCHLWGQATATDPESEAVRLAVFTLIGQLMYFRVGQPIVARRMGWDHIGPAEIERVTQRIIANLDAMLDRETGG